jgi:hypothetical protein
MIATSLPLAVRMMIGPGRSMLTMPRSIVIVGSWAIRAAASWRAYP